MNRRIFTAALSALLFTGVSAFAQSSTWTIDTNHAQTNFKILHMGVSTVRGSISGVTGTIVWDEKDQASRASRPPSTPTLCPRTIQHGTMT